VKALLVVALVGCASQGLVRHPDGTFEGTDGVCFRYVAAGAWATTVRVRCPEPRP
jgi:hypothetical protein